MFYIDCEMVRQVLCGKQGCSAKERSDAGRSRPCAETGGKTYVVDYGYGMTLI